MGEYRGEVPHAAAFSPDGSLFAISFGPVLLSLSFSLSLYVSLLLSLSVSASHAATGSDSVGSVHARLQGPPHLHLSHRPHPVLPSTYPVAHYPQRNFADFAGGWGSRRSRPTWWPAAENTLSYGICYLCASGGAFTSARASSPSTPSRPPSLSSLVRLHYGLVLMCNLCCDGTYITYIDGRFIFASSVTRSQLASALSDTFSQYLDESIFGYFIPIFRDIYALSSCSGVSHPPRRRSEQGREAERVPHLVLFGLPVAHLRCPRAPLSGCPRPLVPPPVP